MKHSKKYIYLIGFSLLSVAMILTIYNPIRENYVYEKELIFSDIDFEESSYNNRDDSKFINKAKEVLSNLFDDKFNEENYNASVDFSFKNNDTVTVSLYEKSTKEDYKYSISFDLATGKTIEIYGYYPKSISNQDKKSEAYLYDTAKEYVNKLTKYTDDELTFKSSINELTYNLYITTKNNSNYISIILDAYSGDLIYYNNVNYL